MAVTNLIFYPNDILKKTCEAVEEFDEDLDKLVQDLKDSLGHYQGIGLAAPQIGNTSRVFVVNRAFLEEGQGFDPMVFINPEIVDRKGEDTFTEGCLSVPGVTSEVDRSLWVKVKAQDVEGEVFEYEGSGYTAAAMQHELDHLNGIMFMSHLSPLKRRLLMKKYKKVYKKNDLGSF